ncbi:hypothetical protein IFM61606_08699, partial [Aspergillus udagawae]
MDNDVKADRKALYQRLHMGGPPPSIWDSTDWLTGCIPPCIVVFPLYPLSVTHNVTSWPALTTALLSSDVGGGGVYVKTTTIPVPIFTITDVSLHPVTLQSTGTANYQISPVQSITPASFLWTLPPNHATFPVTSATPITPTATDVPLPTIPPVTSHPTPVPVTIQRARSSIPNPQFQRYPSSSRYCGATNASKLNSFKSGETFHLAKSCPFSTKNRRSTFPLSSSASGHTPSHILTYGSTTPKASLSHTFALLSPILPLRTIPLSSSFRKSSLSCPSLTAACITPSNTCDRTAKSNSPSSTPTVSSTATAAKNSTSSSPPT